MQVMEPRWVELKEVHDVLPEPIHGRVMNYFDRVQSFVELCHSPASSNESMEAAFRKTLEELGFRYFACCSHVDPLDHPSHAIVLHNYPTMWVQHFSDKRFHCIDPVLKHAERHQAPFFWDTAFTSQPITEAQKKILAEAATVGLVHGYTVPINASWIPGSLRASCSVIPESNIAEPASYLTVQVMALYLYACVSSAQTARIVRIPATSTELTKRERQCLTLAAQGKDDWAIGRVLSLSQHTVHSHIERIKQRYRVSTRVQAVVEGVMTGQISLGDVARR
jgi:DNA-binding CsgD family transcriptional regulator